MTPNRSAATRPCRAGVTTTVLAVTARTVLLTALMLGVWSIIPTFSGWTTTTVASDSMAPVIRAGDVVAAAPVADDALTEGRVALADDPDHDGRRRLHRIHRVEDDGSLVLKGDANTQADSTPVEPDAVIGIGVVRVPWVGLPGLWLRTGEWSALATGVAATALLLAVGILDRDLRRGAPCPRCGAPRWDPHRQGDPVPSAMPGSGLVAVVAVGALLASTMSSAAFTSSTDTASHLGTQTFPCFDRPADGAVLAWDFHEPRGTGVIDRSGHGEDAEMIGATRYDASCTDDPAISLTSEESSSRAISVRQQTAPTTFSIEAWFRTTTPQGHIVGFGSDTSFASSAKDRFLYVSTTGTLRFGVQGSETGFRFTVPSTGRVDDGAWHHAVGTFTPGRQTLWLDGVRQGDRPDNSSPRVYSGFWRVGRQSLDAWPYTKYPYEFNGLVDHVRVYPTVLDEATVRAHHAAGR